jgi:hypothetical protein
MDTSVVRCGGGVNAARILVGGLRLAIPGVVRKLFADHRIM